MPAVYELFVLTKNSLSTAAVKTLMRSTGRTILSGSQSLDGASSSRGSGSAADASTSTSSSTSSIPSGVIMDVKYFGEQNLAYTIRRPGERHASALMWQMTFGCTGDRVAEVERGLRLDEGVVRWQVVRRRYPYGEGVKLSSFKVAERARAMWAEEGERGRERDGEGERETERERERGGAEA
jgi:ribosomal protein S6